MSATTSQPAPERVPSAPARARGDGEFSAVAGFLLALTKAMKGVQFYPESHPALKAILAKCHAAAGPLFSVHRVLAFEARSQKIFFAGQPVSPEVPEIRSLATECVHRRVRKFQIDEGVQMAELDRFVRALTTPPDALQIAGGIERHLFGQEVKRISVNEVDYQDLLYGDLPEDTQDDLFAPEGDLADDEPEEDPFALPEDATPLQEQIIKLLQELNAATEARAYGERAAALVSRVNSASPPPELEDVYRGLRVLCSHAVGREDRERDLVPHALWALRELATPPAIDFLVDKATASRPGTAAKLITLLGQMSSEIIPQLIDHLGRVKVIHARRVLSTVIRGFGEVAVPPLLDVLNDDRWYLIRNAVAILGEIGDPASLSSLEPLASNAEPRVAREALRAFGKIRHPESRKVLERFLTHARGELQLLAAFALGVLRDHEAIPVLGAMLPRRVVFTNFPLQHEIIKALAKIGTPQSVPLLGRLFRRRSLLARARNEELRVIAAQALARIDSEEARAVLAGGLDSGNREIARVCRTALHAEAKG